MAGNENDLGNLPVGPVRSGMPRDLPGPRGGCRGRSSTDPRENPPGIWGMVPEGSPTENAPLHSVPPAGGGSAYAGSLAPALRGNITHPDRGEGPPRGFSIIPNLRIKGKRGNFSKKNRLFSPERNGFFRKKRVVFPRKRPQKRESQTEKRRKTPVLKPQN